VILPNNPRIDPADIEARIASMRARRAPRDLPPMVPAALPPSAPAPPASSPPPSEASPPPGAVAPSDPPGDDRARPRWQERLRALPVVGPLAYFLWSLAKLPRFRDETVVALEALRRDASRSESQGDLRARIERLEQQLSDQTQALRVLERRVQAADWPASQPAGAAQGAPPAQAPSQGAGTPGGFYVEFEDRFRGSRESIKARQRHYLDLVSDATAGRASARCVDIGCGRGEWLELLRERGLQACGLDLDVGMVMSASRLGLDAREGDGIAWLEAQPQASLDVITAFHVIEHLSFERVLRLLDASLRALTPNGVAIFETPNPENLLVATNSFHLDPTHLRPIPPPLAEFLAHQRGFARAEILRLNPLPAEMHFAGDSELDRRLNQLLYGAQDYALVAWKRRADSAN
jgi:O-antigen chain-terminating methyltransferase